MKHLICIDNEPTYVDASAVIAVMAIPERTDGTLQTLVLLSTGRELISTVEAETIRSRLAGEPA